MAWPDPWQGGGRGGQQYGPPPGHPGHPGQQIPPRAQPGEAPQFGQQSQYPRQPAAPRGSPQQSAPQGGPSPAGQQPGPGWSVQPGFPPQSQGSLGAWPGGFGGAVPPRKPGEAYVLIPGSRIQFDASGPLELGSLLDRFLARLLDLLMVGAVLSAALVPLAFIVRPDYGFLDTESIIALGYAVLLPLILMVYEAVGLSRSGRTLGKKIMGLRVVTQSSSATGTGFAAGTAIGRAFLTSGLGVLNVLLFLGSLLLVLFYLSPVFDMLGRRGWHDAYAKTYVISTNPA